MIVDLSEYVSEGKRVMVMQLETFRRYLLALGFFLLVPNISLGQDLDNAQKEPVNSLAGTHRDSLRLYFERTRLEERIARERIVVERLAGLTDVVREGIKKGENWRLLQLQPADLRKMLQLQPLDPTTLLNDPVRRDIRFFQAEESVNAIRDSLIGVISESEVKKLAEKDFTIAIGWYLKSRYRLAEPLLTDFIQTYPRSNFYDEAMVMLGNIYLFYSRFDEAEKLFSELTTTDYEGADQDIRTLAFGILQDLYYRQEKWDEATAVYQDAADQFFADIEGFDGAIYIGGDSYYQKALSMSSANTNPDGSPGQISQQQVTLLDSSIAIFNQVPEISPIFVLAQQQIAQAYIESGRLEDSIGPLLEAERARPPLWADDSIFESMLTATARLGHVYFQLARQAAENDSVLDEASRYLDLAMDQYGKVPQDAMVYDEVLIALSWVEIERNNTESAVRLLEHLLAVRPDSKYSYEAWVTLGDQYNKLGEYDRAHEVFSQLVVTERAVAMVNESVQESAEIDAVHRELDRLARQVETEGDLAALDRVSDQLDSLAKSKMKVLDVHSRLFEADPMAVELINYGQMKTTLASLSGSLVSEKAALNVVGTGLSAVEREVLSGIRNKDAVAKIGQDSQNVNKTQTIAAAFERSLEKDLEILSNLKPTGYDMWLKEASFGKANIEFTKHQINKKALLQQYQIVGNVLREMEQLPEGSPVKIDTRIVLGELQAEIQALEDLLSESGRSLVAELSRVVARYPDNANIEPLLFQLADAQYDQTENDYLKANERYAAAFESGDDPGESPIADYNTPIRTHERLIREFPQSEFVDQSLFQLGHLLNEQGELERSNSMFERLVNEHPESPLVADAYLRIGDFYFDALFLGLTSLGGEEMMRRAINAYDHVLDHPSNKNFQSALYKLGWSYYNLAAPEERDQYYDDSIEYFTYLLEDSLQVAEYKHFAALAGIEPMALDPGYDLTGEAIKYLAINFRDRVETGREDERRNWASVPAAMKEYVEGLGVDKPYARSLMMSMAEVYKETGQVEAEVTALDSVLAVFPNDPQAPRIMQRIIDGYERLQDMAIVDEEVWDLAVHNNESPEVYLNRARERLFREYGRKWAEALEDTTARREALVLADQAGWRLANYVASLAEDRPSDPTAGIDRAALYFKDYMDDFPESENSYTARWNYSQYMWRLERYDEAYEEFIKVSRDERSDKYQEQAAINAILSAEKMLELERQESAPEPTTDEAAAPPEAPSDSSNNANP